MGETIRALLPTIARAELILTKAVAALGISQMSLSGYIAR